MLEIVISSAFGITFDIDLPADPPWERAKRWRQWLPETHIPESGLALWRC